MPFGLRNAAQSFQRLMDRLLSGLPYVFVYLDDILGASPTMASHLDHLRSLLTILRDNGLLVNLAKCSFALDQVDFLGHHVTAAGIAPLSTHVEAIRAFPQPTTIKDLQRFLGLINFYRRFIPKAAAILLPLTDALANNPKDLQWTTAMTTAFQAAKLALMKATRLQHPRCFQHPHRCCPPTAGARPLAALWRLPAIKSCYCT